MEEAKRLAEPPVDAETLDAWDVLARDTTAASAFTSLSQRCANALATAVEALRQMQAPAEVPIAEPVGPEPQWSAPLVFTFEGKVKP